MQLPTLFKKLNPNKGFTLVELLVAMAIVGIISTSTIAVFRRFNQQQNITIAAKDIRTALAEAKANAASNVVTNCNSSTGILRGYRLSGTTSSRTYTLHELCETSPGNVVQMTPKNKNLPSGVSFANGFSITFNTLTGVATAATISITSGGTPIPIAVTAQGVIQ